MEPPFKHNQPVRAVSKAGNVYIGTVFNCVQSEADQHWNVRVICMGGSDMIFPASQVVALVEDPSDRVREMLSNLELYDRHHWPRHQALIAKDCGSRVDHIAYPVCLKAIRQIGESILDK